MSEYLKALRNADLVVWSGASRIASTSEGDARSTLESLRLARAWGACTVMLGQGLGPIGSRQLWSTAQAVLPHVDLICLREGRRGPALLAQLGVDSGRVQLTGDDVLELVFDARPASLGDGIGISVSRARDLRAHDQIVDRMRGLLHEAASRRRAPLLPLPMAFGRSNSDLPALSRLLDNLPGPPGEEGVIAFPDQLIRRIGRCRVVVADSYDAAVFALGQGIPVVGLASADHDAEAFLGLAELFGEGCALVDLRASDALAALRVAIEHAWVTAERIRPSLLAAVQRQIGKALSAYGTVFDIVEERKKPPRTAALLGRSTPGRAPFAPADAPGQAVWPSDLPMVSVVIPCFNYGLYLTEAIQSVQAQTLRDVEIIVVDDGSSDPHTIRVLDMLRAPRTSVLRFSNAGLPEARNRGIRKARGKYICCLDADDTLEPTYLEKAVSLLEHDPSAAFAYSWVRLFGDESRIWPLAPFNLLMLLRHNHVCNAAVFRRDAWEHVGGFWRKMRKGYEDWEFWIRVGAAGYRGELIPEPLFNYRRHGRTLIHEAERRHEQLVRRIRRRHARLFRSAEMLHAMGRRPRIGHAEKPFINMARPAQYQTSGSETRCLLAFVQRPGAGVMQEALFDIFEGCAGRGKSSFVIAATAGAGGDWPDTWRLLAPNTYQLPHFLRRFAWEEFILNLIRTRRVDTVLVAGSGFGYEVLPRVTGAYPSVRLFDVVSADPGSDTLREALDYDRLIHLHIPASDEARAQLLASGVPDARLRSVRSAVDAVWREYWVGSGPVEMWEPADSKRAAAGLLRSSEDGS